MLACDSTATLIVAYYDMIAAAISTERVGGAVQVLQPALCAASLGAT